MRRKVKICVIILCFALALTTLLFAPGCIGRMLGGKYSPPDFETEVHRPHATPRRPERVAQVLPHTCGLRSMESAYRAYGLDPDAFDIRYRLGTDFAAIPVDPDSTGTLHPDLLRVLAQDGFTTTVLDLDRPDAAQQLTDHFGNGQLALTVVYRSTYHWMVLAPDGAGRLWVVDSLSDAGRACGIQSFVENNALSVILIQRRNAFADTPSRASQHLLGTREMARTYERQRARAE